MDSIVQTATETERLIREALIQLTNNLTALEKWIECSSKNILIIGKALKKGSLNIGQKMHMESCQGKLKGYRVMKALNKHGGVVNMNNRSHRLRWQEVLSNFKSRIRTGVIVNFKHTDPGKFLKDSLSIVGPRFKNTFKTNHHFKVNVTFDCEYRKVGSDEVDSKHFYTRNSVIDRQSDLKKWWTKNIETQILVQMAEYQNLTSGWILKAVLNLTVNINKYKPMIG